MMPSLSLFSLLLVSLLQVAEVALPVYFHININMFMSYMVLQWCVYCDTLCADKKPSAAERRC
jgi:hypothetical protein